MIWRTSLLLLIGLAGAAVRPPVGPSLPRPIQTTHAIGAIDVAAGSIARRMVPISFPLPGARPDAAYVLRGTGPDLPLQMATGIAWAIIPALEANQVLSYAVVNAGAPHGEQVQASRNGDLLAFAARGRAIADYVGGPGALPASDIKPIFQRGGYLHPVRTPSGRIVTGDYPPDHRHHHGIWFAWTRTTFQGREPDFWNMGDGKGRVEFEEIERSWAGAVHAGFVARHRYVDLTSAAPITALREEWTARLFAAAPRAAAFLFDVDVSQTNVSDAPLGLPEYHYGGMAVRGAPEFVTLDTAVFLTSEGKDRKTGDAAPSRWAAMAAPVNGSMAGIAMLAHPSNFRAPEPMRIHPTDPYMCYAPSKAGAWAIPARGTHRVRYRFVAFDGRPDAAELERLWRDFAEPPYVTVR